MNDFKKIGQGCDVTFEIFRYKLFLKSCYFVRPKNE